MVFEGTMFDWSISYFDKVIKADPGFVTAGYTAFITSMTTGRFVGDKLIHFFGHLKMVVINGILIATGFAIAVLFPYIWSASFGFLLIGFGDSILVPAIYSLATQSKKMLPSYAIASVTFIGYIGFLTAPLFVGSISNAFGMQYSFALMIVFGSMISVIALVIKKHFF
jgi:MFS family permease